MTPARIDDAAEERAWFRLTGCNTSVQICIVFKCNWEDKNKYAGENCSFKR